MKSIRTRRRSKDNRAVDRVVYRAVHQAVIDAVNVAAWWTKAINLGLPVIGVVAEVVWAAVDGAVVEAVCWVAVNRAAQDDTDHPALQDFLKGVET